MASNAFKCRVLLHQLPAAAVGRGWCAMPSLAQVCADAGSVKCEALDASAASSAPEVPIVNVKEELVEAMEPVHVKEEPFNCDEEVHVKCEVSDAGAASSAPEIPIENIREELLDAMEIISVKEEPFNYDEKAHELPSPGCGDPPVPPPPLCVPCKREAPSEVHEAPHAPQQPSAMAGVTEKQRSSGELSTPGEAAAAAGGCGHVSAAAAGGGGHVSAAASGGSGHVSAAAAGGGGHVSAAAAGGGGLVSAAAPQQPSAMARVTEKQGALDASAASSAPEVPIVYVKEELVEAMEPVHVKEELVEAMEPVHVKEESFNCDEEVHVKCEVLDAGAASSAPEVPMENIKEELLDAMEIISVKEEPFNYDEKAHELPSPGCGDPPVPPSPLCVPCKKKAPIEAHEALHAPQQPLALAGATKKRELSVPGLVVGTRQSLLPRCVCPARGKRQVRLMRLPTPPNNPQPCTAAAHRPLLRELQQRLMAVATSLQQRLVAVATSLQQRLVAVATSLQQRLVAVATSLQQRLVAVATSLQQRLVAVATSLQQRLVAVATSLQQRLVAVATSLQHPAPSSSPRGCSNIFLINVHAREPFPVLIVNMFVFLSIC
ncbi:uncharacterized protein LOC108665489 [Hyalella azteca]|uniref:Uncharacterized protein LOC108665489 n=1 Tax=Hyalella azteca TaxID=294128 RepID=A0A979FIC6_HYAAZ|nr:uncharacterized protein LOC108665489 [Hyalella azteca]